MSNQFEDMDFVTCATELARQAGKIALDYYRVGEKTTACVEHKDGGSPVTEADKRVDGFLRKRLLELAPDGGWLSEETIDNADRLTRERIFIVDPIDGTRAFMSGDPRWGVCVALIEAGRPSFGIFHMPAMGVTYVAARGRGATRNGLPILASSCAALTSALIAGPKGTLRALSDAGVSFRSEPRIPSLAYRLVRVAEGSLDGAIASTNACDWDIAAADAILVEAGGSLTDVEGLPPVYNKVEFRHGMLCAAPAAVQGDLIRALREALGENNM